MSQIWCWSAGGQGWGPGAGASLLVTQSWVLTWQTPGLRCSWDWFPPTGLWGQNSGYPRASVCPLANTSVLMVAWTTQNGFHQCRYPQGELHLPPISLGSSPILAGRSDPGSFQITSSSLSPGACEILCMPLKTGVLISHSPLALWEVIPTGLQSQLFWGLIFPVQAPWAEDPDVRLGSLLGENICNCNYSPNFGTPTQGYGSWL